MKVHTSTHTSTKLLAVEKISAINQQHKVVYIHMHNITQTQTHPPTHPPTHTHTHTHTNTHTHMLLVDNVKSVDSHLTD